MPQTGVFTIQRMNWSRRFFLGALLSTVCGFWATGVQAQSNTEKFGQNRVQYKDFAFQYYESDNYTTYFYQGGQDVAKYVIKTAEDVTDDISKLLDFRYHRKIDIIVYNNINELNQTNIGIYEPSQNPGGTTKIPDNKIFVYFNGDHRHLDQQIRQGIAKIFVDKMVMGSSFAEVVQNAVLLNLPDWYKLGLVKYISESWSSEMEDHLRDGILSGRYRKLSKLPAEEAIFVGQSIWHYIEEVHGKTAVSNIIYLTRVNRSVDNGFLFVLGTDLQQTLSDWYTYYYNRFTNEKNATLLPAESGLVKTKIRKFLSYYQPCLSTDGKHIAYASNDMGRYRVHLLNTENNKAKVIFRGGFRTNTIFTDESIPLLAFDPSGKKLAIISDKRAQIYLRLYDLETGKMEVNPVRKFQKVVSFSFVDSKQLVMSAIQNGQTDIYLYTIASTTTRKLTDDYFDDLDPAYITADSIRGIMFSSNRPDDTLRSARYESQNVPKMHDLFFYDLDANNNVLYRITNTPLANETNPQNFSENEFCYLSDANGIRNRYIGHFESVFDHNQKTYHFTLKETEEEDSLSLPENTTLDSVMDTKTITLNRVSNERVYKIGGVTSPFTNNTYGIRNQSTVMQRNQVLDMLRVNGKARFYKYVLSAYNGGGQTYQSPFMNNLKAKTEEAAKAEEKKAAEEVAPTPVITDTLRNAKGSRPFDFQSEFDYGIKLFDWDSASASRLAAEKEGYVFRFSRVRPYFVRFAVDKVVTQIDNNLMVTRYQPFDPAVPQYNLNPVSFMFKFGITDLLENHKLYGGIRLPFVGIDNNSEYFITYENLTKRLDKKFTFYRRNIGGKAYDKLPFTNTVLPGDYSVDYNIKTNYAEVQLNYPLDVLNSLRFNIAFRNDLVTYKSKDTFSLRLPNNSDNWLMAKAEYVFDNCMEVMTNIRYGTKFKVFAEIHKEFPTTNKVLFDKVDLPVPQFNNKFMTVIGLDLRHYQKIYKQIIWASRLAMGASFGTSKLIYYLGGLDNWIASPRLDKFDRTTPIDLHHNYAFQTLSTPLRGFKQNARNGDKYIVFNTELRVPIFAALINSPIKSEFIRNMQLVGFFDAGTAWQGWSPFSDQNPLYNEEIPNTSDNPSVIARVKRYKTPVIMGFGPGIRTTFLGYFIRFDTAWGYDTGEVSKKPMYYFTFGLDF